MIVWCDNKRREKIVRTKEDYESVEYCHSLGKSCLYLLFLFYPNVLKQISINGESCKEFLVFLIYNDLYSRLSCL